MTVIQAFILGLVQGLTEFLPISSSGHLVLFQQLFHLQQGVVSFDIAVHFATLIAVIVVLWRDVLDIIKKPLGKLALLIVAATIPTLVIAAASQNLVESLLKSGKSLGIEFILTGLILWYAEGVKTKNKQLKETTYKDAVIIGIAQGIAILPAISRSGLTIAGSLSRGLKREFALRLSFLISIPAILAATLKDGYDAVKAGTGLGIDVLPLVVGMAVAAVTGYLAVRFMLKVFSKASMKIFSIYVFILGALVLIDQLFFGHFFPRLF